MIRRQRKRAPIISDSSDEDDSPQPRRPFKSSKTQNPQSADNDPFKLKNRYKSKINISAIRKILQELVNQGLLRSYFRAAASAAHFSSIQRPADRRKAAIARLWGFGTAIVDPFDDSPPNVPAQYILRNDSKKRPISTSNINDSRSLSIGDSDYSFPIKTSGMRGARVALSESDQDAGSQYPSTLKDISLDSSSDESEHCPICFMHFNSQEVGTPAKCDHCFCLTCLQKWAKNNSTCPVDRMSFNSIIVRSYNSRNVIREIPVETVIPTESRIEEWDPNLMDILNYTQDEDISSSTGDSDSSNDSDDSE